MSSPVVEDNPGPVVDRETAQYVGFRARLWAAVVDTVLFTLILVPPIWWLFGDQLYEMFLAEMERSIDQMPGILQGQIAERYPWLMDAIAQPGVAEVPPHLNLLINLVSAVIIAVLVLIFWRTRGATPGKMILRAVILDAKSFQPANNTQLVIRYIGYYLVAFFTLGIGFFLIGLTPRKQGLHDFLARTVVVKLPK